MRDLKGQKKQQQFYMNKYIVDPRPKQERAQHLKYGRQLTNRNIKLWDIDLTQKSKTVYKQPKLVKIQFKDGWYAMITDNQVQSQFGVLTIHGAPGNHKEWAGLQTEMGDNMRQINLVVPGFDGLDERRGNYSGSSQDFAKLICMILQAKNITKVIICAHSFGTIISTYFISQYRHLVLGFISVAGMVNIMSVGIMMMYSNIIGAHGATSVGDRRQYSKQLNQDQFRIKLGQRFTSNTHTSKYTDNISVIPLSVPEICAVIKLMSSFPEGFAKFYQIHRQLTIFKVLLYGNDDKLLLPDKAAYQIHDTTRGNKIYHIQSAKIRDQIHKQIKQEFNVQINPQKLQQYFCFIFDQTGHNVHKRRPIQISKIIKIYIKIIKILDENQTIIAKL